MTYSTWDHRKCFYHFTVVTLYTYVTSYWVYKMRKTWKSSTFLQNETASVRLLRDPTAFAYWLCGLEEEITCFTLGSLFHTVKPLTLLFL